jgi:hypothetical protein
MTKAAPLFSFVLAHIANCSNEVSVEALPLDRSLWSDMLHRICWLEANWLPLDRSLWSDMLVVEHWMTAVLLPLDRSLWSDMLDMPLSC